MSDNFPTIAATRLIQEHYEAIRPLSGGMRPDLLREAKKSALASISLELKQLPKTEENKDKAIELFEIKAALQ